DTQGNYLRSRTIRREEQYAGSGGEMRRRVASGEWASLSADRRRLYVAAGTVHDSLAPRPAAHRSCPPWRQPPSRACGACAPSPRKPGGLTASSSSFAATAAPWVRIVPATAVARAQVLAGSARRPARCSSQAGQEFDLAGCRWLWAAWRVVRAWLAALACCDCAAG